MFKVIHSVGSAFVKVVKYTVYTLALWSNVSRLHFAFDLKIYNLTILYQNPRVLIGEWAGLAIVQVLAGRVLSDSANPVYTVKYARGFVVHDNDVTMTYHGVSNHLYS